MAMHADTTTRKPTGRVSLGFTIALLALGWVALFWATDLALLASIQAGMIGLGLIGSAITVAVLRSR